MQYIILKKIKSRLLAGMMFYLRLVGIIDTRPFTGMINVAIHQMPNQDINRRLDHQPEQLADVQCAVVN